MERKVFEIKGATLTGNDLKGDAAAMGNLDRGWDVIFPGAFRGVLDSFLKDGFVAVGHDWHNLPVAMPTKAEERGRALYTEAVFHSTQTAQDARTIARERIEAGKSVGLSIGFDLKSSGYKYFDSGEELLKFAEAMNADLSQFDAASIEKHNDYCRGIWQVDTLYEYSIVSAPMNPLATATEAKSGSIQTERDFERFLRDAGYSRKEAAAIALHGFKAIGSQRDADETDKPSLALATETLKAKTEYQRLLSRLRNPVGATL